MSGIQLLTACSRPPESISNRPDSFSITLIENGDSSSISSSASTVRELLDQNEIEIEPLDEVVPPIFTPLADGLTIEIIRVSESFEVIQQTIPFERKFVRSESMQETDDPIIVQAGQDGLQETTWRIVYRNGLEAERWPTNTVIVEQAVEEIVMVGIGAIGGTVTFPGLIAYLSDGAPLLLRGSNAFPEQLKTGGQLDGRVFKLSPTGSHLLYTQVNGDNTQFNNSLWVIRTIPGSLPRQLNVENVLWAEWNPAKTELMEIAYSTARPTDAPPGWEANNDLWRGDVLRSETAVFSPTQIIEAYPATYGWWGGNYAWSPDGRQLAYSFADEVGIIDMTSPSGTSHRPLQSFTEYNTLSNWVWVPSLSWSPDSRFIAFTNHGSQDNRQMQFDTWVVDSLTGVAGKFVEQTGMWGHVHWAANDPETGPNGRISFLKSSDPIDSQRSSYTLWLMDKDGSNSRQIFPPPGENSAFPRYTQFMSWGPDGNELSFIFNNQLYLLSLDTNESRRLTQDDSQVSHPTWAPYGAGLTQPETDLIPTPTPDFIESQLPQE